MAKLKTSIVFKPYDSGEISLFPSCLSELIEPNHLVRVVSNVIDSLDLTSLLKQYKGGGTSAYHPRMLLKVLLYAYCTKIYTGRKIAKALRESIPFMWLSGRTVMNFRTINHFRSGKAKNAIEGLFKEMLKFLMEQGYIKMENYFCDGSTFRADANMHKMIWKKSAIKFKELAEQRFKELFRQNDLLNDCENKQYCDLDLEETGSHNEAITPEVLQQQVTKLNQVMEKAETKKDKRKAITIKKRLQEQQDKIIKYNEQIKVAGSRGGYNNTDEDASGLRMKNQEILPAYNVLAGCENQMIVNCTVHQNTNDATCFRAHIEQLERYSNTLPENIIADSIYGTEENYEIIEQKNINNYLKYPPLHREEMVRYKPEPFSNSEFIYDALTNNYTCPNGRTLEFKGVVQTNTRLSGYQSTSKIYQSPDCSGCPFFEQCCGPKKETNRRLLINEKLEEYKRAARKNLQSEKGWVLRKQRNTEIESCFGDVKHNMRITRCHLRGLQKVHADFCMIAIAHNLRKIQINNLKKVA